MLDAESLALTLINIREQCRDDPVKYARAVKRITNAIANRAKKAQGVARGVSAPMSVDDKKVTDA